MSNYNSQLQSNNTDLQAILNTINELPSSGGSDPVLQDKTITPTTSKQTITADSGYDGLDTVTVNAMPTATQATPTVTINSSGLITATATQTAGYVAAGTKSATKQLAFQAAQTITPGTSNKTIAANTYLGGVQTIKGDANLVAGNIKNGTSIFGVTGTYVGSGGSGGDTSIEDSLVTRTVTTYTNNRVTTIGLYAFYRCFSLTSISFPSCKTIGDSAFYRCSSLTSISFPVCSKINLCAFYDCQNLKTANFPSCKTIGSSAFQGCSSLTSISFPSCEAIERQVFYRCYSLTAASFPSCEVIYPSAFYQCSNLTSASFPVCTIIYSDAFYQCRNLKTVSFPSCEDIYASAFYGCSSLTSASLPVCTLIGSFAFAYCSRLTSIYLGATTLCNLLNSNAFSGTGIWSTKGSIFVPASLLASYKAATNWAFFSNRIFSYAF